MPEEKPEGVVTPEPTAPMSVLDYLESLAPNSAEPVVTIAPPSSAEPVAEIKEVSAAIAPASIPPADTQAPTVGVVPEPKIDFKKGEHVFYIGGKRRDAVTIKAVDIKADTGAVFYELSNGSTCSAKSLSRK